ncbi:AzlD domain-containing protein [Acinetobacter equi]|uniref:Branched-chain amino acid transporter n=1 Tax=Acinetobacter equi TaxID=1324350 RepID=A0A0N9W3N2_9GAMM|nr:AzlD domain-containing protein [Acinetobacter equi]ALH95649.1 branched-chain amino acid transporter [Acinetobacter equi]
MIWLLILGLSSIVFFNRYVFLEPTIRFHLPKFLTKMLNYAAPCLMVSLCIPIIFYQSSQFRGVIDNIYLYSAIFTILFVLITRHLLMSVVFSLMFFYFLLYIL